MCGTVTHPCLSGHLQADTAPVGRGAGILSDMVDIDMCRGIGLGF